MQKSGYDRLPDLQRYLQAVDKRIDKLAQDVNRDRAAMLRVEQVQQTTNNYWLNYQIQTDF